MARKRVIGVSVAPVRGMTTNQRDDLLIENFVGLQKAMTNLSMKFGELSDNISKLLQVFELAAKNVAEDGAIDGKEVARKLETLIEQNKTIAQGLVLLESKFGGQRALPTGPKPLPRI